MEVKCEECNSVYRFDEDQVSDRGVKVKCSHCGHMFVVRRSISGIACEELEDEDDLTPQELAEELRNSTSDKDMSTPPPARTTGTSRSKGPSWSKMKSSGKSKEGGSRKGLYLGLLIVALCGTVGYMASQNPEMTQANLGKGRTFVMRLYRIIMGPPKVSAIAEAHYSQAWDLMRQGHNDAYGQAVEQMSKALQISPSYPKALASMGELILLSKVSQESSQDAWNRIQESLNLNPRESNAYRARALYFQRMREPLKAEKEIKQALEINERDAMAYYYFGMMFGTDESLSSLARQHYERAIQLDQGLMQPRLALAKMSMDKEDWDRAKERLTGILDALPEHPVALELMKEIEAAQTPKVIPKKPQPKGYSYYLKRGINFHQQQRFAEATQAFDQAERMRSDRPDLHTHKGFLQIDMGSLQAATQSFLTALTLDGDYADAHVGLGIIYSDQGRVQEAMQEYSTYLDLAPNGERAREVEALLDNLLKRQGQQKIQIEVGASD